MYSSKAVQSSTKIRDKSSSLRLAVDLEEYGKVEQMPKLEGKRMTMFIAPIKKK